MISHLPCLERLQRALQDARGPAEVEGVHQVRVATRRLDTWLRLGGRRALRDDLAWLRRSAAGVRDLDVVAALPAAEELGPWLGALRRGARGAMLVAWASPRLDGLLDGLAALPPLSDSTARRGLEHLGRRLRAAAAATGSNGDLAAVHRLRRALRRVRYGLEWLGEKSEVARELQDVLGALNDLRLLRELCEREDAPPLAAQVRAGCALELERALERAHASWDRERSDLLEAWR